MDEDTMIHDSELDGVMDMGDDMGEDDEEEETGEDDEI